MEDKRKFRPDSGLKLMDQVRQVLRYHHYAYRTEQTYCDWIVRYVKFHGGETHPKDMGKKKAASVECDRLPVLGGLGPCTCSKTASIFESCRN